MPEPSEVEKKLDELYFLKLHNLEVVNPKLVVLFSGANAVGKSTLARTLGSELHGLVIENDAIREIISDTYPHLSIKERNQCTWQYSMSLYQRLGSLTTNGLIMRDGVIDWHFDQIIPIFEKQGYKIFVIGFDVSREKRLELIQKRGDKATIPVAKLIDIIDRHDEPIRKFRSQNKVEVMLTEENLFDHYNVVNILREKIKDIS